MSELERMALAGVLALFYIGFSWACFARHRRLRRRGAGEADRVIAYASQSGRAHALAEKTLEAFADNARLITLNQLDSQTLEHAQALLVIASTYGEGEPPDNGAQVEAKLLRHQLPELSHLRFAVLALGDSGYTHYCAFGRRVFNHLAHRGAHPIDPLAELDASKPQDERRALVQWQRTIASLGGEFPLDDASKDVLPDRLTLTITHRQCLNPQSPGEPLYWLRLQASEQTLDYRAGDIVEVYPRHLQGVVSETVSKLAVANDYSIDWQGKRQRLVDFLATREYRLADVPAQPCERELRQWLKGLPEHHRRQYTIANAHNPQALELVVRQQQNAAGGYGLASGWLTQAPINTPIELCIRDNAEFHTPPTAQPLILIGNGSGIAGLRAHLQHRANTGGEHCWLIYGERDPAADRPFAEEIEALRASGVLHRVNLAYSRSADNPEYVQDCLRKFAPQIRQWLERGACIYVCGSRTGMAEAVDEQLREIIGEQALRALHNDGRYRRDVY